MIRRLFDRLDDALSPWAWIIVGIALGLTIGVYYAWMINPVTLTDMDPVDLNPGWKQTWVRMAADSYALHQDPAAARVALSSFSRDEAELLLHEAYVATSEPEERRQIEALAQAAGLHLAEPTVLPQHATSAGSDAWRLYAGVVVLAGIALLVVLVRTPRPASPRPVLHRTGVRAVLLLTITVVAASFLATLTLAGTGDLPPRPPMDPEEGPTTTSGDGDKERAGATIELHVPAPRPEYWTVVQWQDADGIWHDVDGWQGSLEYGKKVWWVAPADFRKGPFRWVVYGQKGGTEIAVSDPFSLPQSPYELMKIEAKPVP